MNSISRRAFAAYAGFAALGLTHAQTPFPSKTLSLLVPYAPGGPTDAMARILATAIKPVLGQTMIVENKAGAGSNIGAEYVARAEADGHTLLFGTSAPLGINLYLYPKINYDPFKSFAPVIQVGYLPNVLVVHPSVPAKNVKELIAYAKANPNKLAFASSGSGASSHLAGVMFNMRAGTDVQHIPYKGTGPALNDLLGGQVAMSFTDVLTALPHIQAGKLRVLGVTSANRSRVLPDVPTLAEQGLKDFDASVFFGIVVPSGTPQEVVTRLNGSSRRQQCPRSQASRCCPCGSGT
jgi:tripartite-type tricarboxylate transporter receptor subunit TctC